MKLINATAFILGVGATYVLLSVYNVTHEVFLIPLILANALCAAINAGIVLVGIVDTTHA